MIEALSPAEVDRVISQVPEMALFLLKTSHAVLAGGFVRDVLLGLSPKDLDIFCDSANEANLAAYYATLYTPGARVKRSTYARSVELGGMPVQFVFYREFASAGDLVSQFDFRACAAGVYWSTEREAWQGVCVSGFHEDLANRRLTFLHQPKDAGSLVPLKRALHLVSKGWKLPDESVAGILTHWRPSLADQPEEPNPLSPLGLPNLRPSGSASVLRSLRPGSYGGTR